MLAVGTKQNTDLEVFMQPRAASLVKFTSPCTMYLQSLPPSNEPCPTQAHVLWLLAAEQAALERQDAPCI